MCVPSIYPPTRVRKKCKPDIDLINEAGKSISLPSKPSEQEVLRPTSNQLLEQSAGMKLANETLGMCSKLAFNSLPNKYNSIKEF